MFLKCLILILLLNFCKGKVQNALIVFFTTLWMVCQVIFVDLLFN